MVQKNYDFLTENVLPGLGFAKTFDDALKANMEAGKDKISLTAAEKISDKTFAYQINLERKEEMYYLNTVKASITNEKQEVIAQEFQLFKQRGFNRSEMDNLLEGRAVYKNYVNAQGERNGQWTWLDLSKTNEKENHIVRTKNDKSHDFRIVKELSKIPLVMMTADQKEDLIFDLMKGKRVAVNLIQAGGRERMFIEANPKISRISVYNGQGQEIQLVKEKSNLVLTTQNGNELSEAAKKLIEKAESKSQETPGKKLKVG